ncbi:hypothetical protein [Mycolicibacterium llatzerense]|uniref:hypothetical protein n=1 Tax=Mycolicibacterium llatzerense TaxID=280871 RepID=UPI0021B6DBF2|nr:hypothetical protein [Mycolicibacterium llatzerense]MCT7372989.1 hypothetical protein [Mycolicibacterium llatzerense]
MHKLSHTMTAALVTASARWDGEVRAARRTWRALRERGLVDVHIGKGRDQHGRTVYGAVDSVKINEAGYQCLIDAGHIVAVAL